AQALEFHRPLTFGPGTEAALRCLRTRVPTLEQDRVLAPDLESARDLLATGELHEVIRQTASCCR
ncbi:MAG: histidine ammonia-lyase, partial [Candidatus Eremiobacterota bacterium]